MPRRKMALGAALFLLAGVWLAQDVARPPAEQLTARAGIALIRVYQQHLHPYSTHLGRCRHHPTCSRYGVEALERKGAAGVVDIGERLYKCSRRPAPPRTTPAPPASHATANTAPTVSLALLQSRGDEEAGAACAALGLLWLLSMLAMVLLFVGMFAFWIWMIVFVVRDAKNRGMDTPALWVIIIIFAHFIGLIIYFVVRPTGTLVECEQCKNKKLETARACPHCGNVDPRAAAPPAGPPAPPAAPAQ